MPMQSMRSNGARSLGGGTSSSDSTANCDTMRSIGPVRRSRTLTAMPARPATRYAWKSSRVALRKSGFLPSRRSATSFRSVRISK